MGDSSWILWELGMSRLREEGFQVTRNVGYIGVSADGGFYERVLIRVGKVSSRRVQYLVNLANGTSRGKTAR